jgi:hypothetical protein
MYKNNIYNNPDKFGMVVLDTVYLSEPDYSFDMLAIWKNESGQYFLGTDSGCSCPSPFENFYGIDDLTGPLTAEQAIEEATSLWSNSYGNKYEPEEFASAMSKIV